MTTNTTPPADGQAATTTDAAADSFEAAFAEFAGASSTGTEADAGVAAQADTPATTDGDSTGGEPSHVGERPASTDEVGAPERNEPGRGGNAPEGDLWSSASEQQRAAYEAAQAQLKTLEHDSRSNRGRVSSLQRELDTVKSQLAALQKGAAGSTGQDQGATEADIRRLQEEYPEVARPVLKELSSLRTQLSETQARLNQRDSTEAQREREQALDREEQALAQQHPDWAQVAASSAFSDWLKTQPRYVVEAIQRNGEAIQDAAEAGDIIARFKAHQGVAGTATAAQPASGAMATGAPANLAARRQRQLESGAAVTSRGAGPAGGPPDDFEAAFNYFAGKKGR
ncbi:hypothetical protein J2847_004129 [Azospirillum agricola]|uniref:hypothetical protein n=1 Tax=Azospirillum agricola TaxID=1720247 RepID=UPI001AEB05AB|nr:hypothetical protein [Azospirillum agricola]MBP2230820.1 hypothetical protein [Azospirillum agricola]